MIDIIIPVYNSDSLAVTLSSIFIQSIREKTKIYIIDDCSTVDYADVLNIFANKLDITYIKLDKNMGPGHARQVGLDNSNSEFVLFIDSDDVLFDCYSLEVLYNHIVNEKLDVVMGNFFIESDTGKTISDEADVCGCLHGKIYRRKHLIDNNIRFNNSRYSEDNSFNFISIVTTKKFKFIDDVVYTYRNNSKSLTRNKSKYIFMHSSYLHNMLWAINILEKKNVDREYILNALVVGYVVIFREVINHRDIDFSKLYLCCSRFGKKYKEYEKYITKDRITHYMDEEYLLEFDEFRKNFESRW